MKKALAAGLLALCVIAASQQQSSAWCKIGFGIGLNFDWQCGGNNLLWGAWQSGPAPGMPYYGGGHGGHHSHHDWRPLYSFEQVQMAMPTFAPPGYAPFSYANNPGPVYYQPQQFFFGQ